MDIYKENPVVIFHSQKELKKNIPVFPNYSDFLRKNDATSI